MMHHQQMPRVSTKVDVCKGHDACPPRPLATFSPDVTAEGLEVAREGDDLLQHGCPKHSPPHRAKISRGFPTVFANGKPVGYVGASVSCASTQMKTGRATVVVGEGEAESAAARSQEGVLVASINDGTSDMGGTLIAFDHGENEGRFTNDTTVPILVIGDKVGSPYVMGTLVKPGESARGDAVMFPDYQGNFSIYSEIYKVPNYSDWSVSREITAGDIPDGEFVVTPRGLIPLLDDVTMVVAKVRNGSDKYELMRLPHFFYIMKKTEIHTTINGKSVIIKL